MSAIFGAGILLPTTGSLWSFNILDHLKYSWKSLEVKEVIASCPVRNPSVFARQEDTLTVLAGSQGDMLKLNGSAFEIWNLCDGKMGVNDMVDRITDRFEVEKNVAKKDVVLTLIAFRRKGLVLFS